MNVRGTAARALYAIVVDGMSMTPALDHLPAPAERDASLLRELVYGCCRWYYRLQGIASLLMDKPLRSRDQDVQMLILVGLYQLFYTRVPAHAAIAETVNGLKALRKDWARGLVNAVLRNAQRRQAELNSALDADPERRHAHPDWLRKAIDLDWGDRAQGIMEANNQHPPMVLRVNSRRISRDEYLERLARADIAAQPHPASAVGIELERPMAVEALPGFAEGLVSVQDAAAQLAAPALDVAPGQRVLDACAAPGGKTSHILELVPDCRLLALDVDPERAARIEDNFRRLGLAGDIRVCDALAVADWWDGDAFDRILLDAPCSGSGVIRRHPDIKILRKQSDIEPLCRRQRDLLEALWPLLANNGKLVYATCSLLKVENEQQTQAFLADHPEARVSDRPPCPGRILPGDQGMDGFYYACFEKRG